MLEDNKKEGREPRDAYDVLIPIQREKCDRVGGAGVPISASVMQPIFNSGRATRHDTQIRQTADPPFPPLRGLQVSRRVRRDRENDGFQAGGHARGQAPIALGVLRDGVRSAPILHHQHGRDGREALGPGAPWLGETEAGRVRFIGAADKRNLTISTVVTMTGTIMAQLIVEGGTKRVVQDLPEHEKICYSFSESHWCTESTCQELIEWLGAWVRKQGFLHWVLLWDCASVHRKAFLVELLSSRVSRAIRVQVAAQRSCSQQTSRSSSL